MYVIVEKNDTTEYHKEYQIANDSQLKEFINYKKCGKFVTHKDFKEYEFSENLKLALNALNDGFDYEVILIRLN